MSAARELTTCVSVDRYSVERRMPAPRPPRRTSQPARWSRAAFSATKFAMAPPEMMSAARARRHAERLGANQRVRCSSISVAAGESSHPPTFMLSPAASRSAAAPGTVPAPET